MRKVMISGEDQIEGDWQTERLNLAVAREHLPAGLGGDSACRLD